VVEHCSAAARSPAWWRWPQRRSGPGGGRCGLRDAAPNRCGDRLPADIHPCSVAICAASPPPIELSRGGEWEHPARTLLRLRLQHRRHSPGSPPRAVFPFTGWLPEPDESPRRHGLQLMLGGENARRLRHFCFRPSPRWLKGSWREVQPSDHVPAGCALPVASGFAGGDGLRTGLVPSSRQLLGPKADRRRALLSQRYNRPLHGAVMQTGPWRPHRRSRLGPCKLAWWPAAAGPESCWSCGGFLGRANGRTLAASKGRWDPADPSRRGSYEPRRNQGAGRTARAACLPRLDPSSWRGPGALPDFSAFSSPPFGDTTGAGAAAGEAGRYPFHCGMEHGARAA